MPLLDHFHAPLIERRTWEGFHGLWAAALVESLNNDVLGEEYFADMQVHIGSRVEVDVATLAENGLAGRGLAEREPADKGPGSDLGTATATGALTVPAWAPPAANLILPTVFPDDIEVQVFATTTGAALVAAIELVSPGNKDRPDERTAFAAKCVSYLTRGIGLIVVDIVTSRLANLHNEVMAMFGRGAPFLLEPPPTTYAVAYRPTRQPSGDRVEIWPAPLVLGQPLPVLPLALRNADTIPVDLEATYAEACRRSRLDRYR